MSQSPFVTSYDPAEMQTVQEFFDSSEVTLAYKTLRDLGIQSEQTFRKVGKRGKGARLYHLSELREVKGHMRLSSFATSESCPDGCMDMKMIAHHYSIPVHQLSSLFQIVHLNPAGSYKPGKRKVNVFSVDDVRYLMECIFEISERFQSQRRES